MNAAEHWIIACSLLLTSQWLPCRVRYLLLPRKKVEPVPPGPPPGPPGPPPPRSNSPRRGGAPDSRDSRCGTRAPAVWCLCIAPPEETPARSCRASRGAESIWNSRRRSRGNGRWPVLIPSALGQERKGLNPLIIANDVHARSDILSPPSPSSGCRLVRPLCVAWTGRAIAVAAPPPRAAGPLPQAVALRAAAPLHLPATGAAPLHLAGKPLKLVSLFLDPTPPFLFHGTSIGRLFKRQRHSRFSRER